MSQKCIAMDIHIQAKHLKLTNNWKIVNMARKRNALTRVRYIFSSSHCFNHLTHNEPVHSYEYSYSSWESQTQLENSKHDLKKKCCFHPNLKNDYDFLRNGIDLFFIQKHQKDHPGNINVNSGTISLEGYVRLHEAPGTSLLHQLLLLSSLNYSYCLYVSDWDTASLSRASSLLSQQHKPYFGFIFLIFGRNFQRNSIPTISSLYYYYCSLSLFWPYCRSIIV